MGRIIVPFPTGQAQVADVGTSQVENLVQRLCPSSSLSGRVGAGRMLAAVNAEWGQKHAGAKVAPQERWSRGCRRADVSFWFSQWALPWLLAPRRKKSSWSSRSLSSRLKPASTSDLTARALRYSLNGPAPHQTRTRARSVAASSIPPTHFRPDGAPLWAGAPVWHIGPSGRHDKGQDRC